jgi:hypothetical protein
VLKDNEEEGLSAAAFLPATEPPGVLIVPPEKEGAELGGTKASMDIRWHIASFKKTFC